MKNIRQDARIDSQSSQVSRRQRTRSEFNCEPLEGRKLMTGVGGAAGAIMPMSAPAEMGDLTDSGTGQDRDSIRFKGAGHEAPSNSTAASSTSDAETSTPDSTRPTDPEMMMTFRSMSGEARTRDFSKHRGDFDSNAGGNGDFHGGMMEGRPGGWLTDGSRNGSSQGSGPMSGSVAATDGTDTSSGNTQLDTDLAKLKADEQAIHDKSEVTPKLMAAVRNDLKAIEKAKTDTVDATLLQTLKTDEQAIFASQAAPTDAQQAQLQADRDAILISQGVSQDLIDQLAADRLAVKTASHFTADDQALLDADHQAIEADRAAAQPTTLNSTVATTDPSTPSPVTASTLAMTTAAPSDPAGTEATPPAETVATTTDIPTAPTTYDPIISQSGRPTMAGKTRQPGQHRHSTLQGRPSANGPGGTNHQGPMSGPGAIHSRRSMRNRG